MVIFKPLRLHMPTTSLKLPDDIEQKASAATGDAVSAPHAFMIETIGQDILSAEKQIAFLSVAQTARSTTLKSGLGYTASDVHQHLLDRINKKIDAAKTKNTVVHTKLTADPWRA